MEINENRMDEAIGEVILSVKAVMLLCGSSVECREMLKEQVISKQDPEVGEFIEMFQKPKENIVPQLVMAAGEILLASILLFLGIALISPSLVGFEGPGAFLNYFISTQISLINAVPFSPFVILIDFLVAVALLSSAFYALRESAEKLAKAGLRYR